MESYNWGCPHPGCKYIIRAYGETSFRTLKELHVQFHEREDKRAAEDADKNFLKNKAEFEAKLLHDAKPPEVLAIAPYRKPNYDKLELTGADRAFLKTRGIKVED